MSQGSTAVSCLPLRCIHKLLQFVHKLMLKGKFQPKVFCRHLPKRNIQVWRKTLKSEAVHYQQATNINVKTNTEQYISVWTGTLEHFSFWLWKLTLKRYLNYKLHGIVNTLLDYRRLYFTKPEWREQAIWLNYESHVSRIYEDVLIFYFVIYVRKTMPQFCGSTHNSNWTNFTSTIDCNELVSVTAANR